MVTITSEETNGAPVAMVEVSIAGKRYLVQAVTAIDPALGTASSAANLMAYDGTNWVPLGVASATGDFTPGDSTLAVAGRHQDPDTLLWYRPKGNAKGVYVVPKSPDGFATAQATVAATATQIVAARDRRGEVTITNLGTTDVFIGGAGVTNANGALLAGVKGATVTIKTAGAVYGIVTAGTQAVSAFETY